MSRKFAESLSASLHGNDERRCKNGLTIGQPIEPSKTQTDLRQHVPGVDEAAEIADLKMQVRTG